MYSIKTREDLENGNQSVSLRNQIKALGLQNQFGSQSFHEDMKKLFELVNKTIKDVSEDVTKTITERSKENEKALANLNKKFLDMMKKRGILATYLLSPLSKITKPEQTSLFKLLKDSDS